MREIVLNRDEFTEYLAERLPESSDIGKMMRFVESAFLLRNDEGRTCYLLEVPQNVSAADVEYIDRCMVALGCLACIVPQGLVSYGGTVTGDSMKG